MSDTIKASRWRCWLIDMAFYFNLAKIEWLSKTCWKASRFLATERTHMALAAYCAGIMISARIDGQYDDPQPELPAYVETDWSTYADATKDGH